MAVTLLDMRLYGSEIMPDSDTPINVGGAIALNKRISFTDVNGDLQVVSSSADDITQTITITYRDGASELQTAVMDLNGQIVVSLSSSPASGTTLTVSRLEKAIKSASCAGDVAVEKQTDAVTGTAQAGSTAVLIKLAAGASEIDNAYRGKIIRLDGGTGQYQIRHIVFYDGTTKEAYVSRAWDVTPDVDTTYVISDGFYFELAPDEATEVRRIFYDAAADIPGGATKEYYEKVFWKNCHATDDLTFAQIAESSDPAAVITFALESTLSSPAASGDGIGDTGSNNRLSAPAASGGVGDFDSADKSTANSGTLTAGAAQGVWLKLTLLAGAGAKNTTYTIEVRGNA